MYGLTKRYTKPITIRIAIAVETVNPRPVNNPPILYTTNDTRYANTHW